MKKNIIKKYLILASVLGISISLIACGNKGQQTEENVPTTEVLENTKLLEQVEEETESNLIEISTEEATETVEDEVQQDESGYTYTDMSETLYATSTVNVRNLPSADGTKLGSLSKNQEVKVTGKCNETNWYRIEYNSDIGFVSNSYLSKDKKAETPTTVDTTSPTKGATGANSISNNGGAQNQASEYFDRAKAEAVFNAVNAERAANGISQLAWDENIYNFACIRAKEIVNDFSHGGSLNGTAYGENIHYASWVESADEIHTSYYNSPKHHENYLYSPYGSGAVAVYVLNGYTYCVENFALAETGSSVSTLEVVDTWTASNGVTLEIMSNGQVNGSYPDFDMLMEAMNEYTATH